MRRTISIILTVLMIVGACPAAFAADDAPACTVAGLAEGENYYLNSGVIPTVAVTSETEITQVDFKVDGVSAFVDTSSPFEWTLPTSGAHEGTHKLGIFVNGSETASKEINYTATCGEAYVDFFDDFEDEAPVYTEKVNFLNNGKTVADGARLPQVIDFETETRGMSGKVLCFLSSAGGAAKGRVFLTPEAKLDQNYDIAVIEFDMAAEATYVQFRPTTGTLDGLGYVITDPANLYNYVVTNKKHVKFIIDGKGKTVEFYLDGVLKKTSTGLSAVPTNLTIFNDYAYVNNGIMIDNLSIKAYKPAPDQSADISCEVGTTDYIITFSNKIFGEDEEANAAIADKVVWVNGEGTVVEDRVNRTFGTDLEGNDYVMLSINEEGVENLASYKIKVDAVEDIYTQILTKEFPFSAFKVTGVAVDKSEISLMRDGATDTLKAVITPDSALNKNVTWTSSDENVATIDEDGVVTSNKPGTAIITVTTEEGGYTATAKVNVINPVTSMTAEGVRSIVDFKPGAPVTGSTGATNAKDEWVTDYTRVGEYALHSTGTGKVSFKINTPFTVDNSAPIKEVLKMWVYNASEDEIRIGTRLQLSSGSYSAYSTQAAGGFTLSPQSWTLIEFPICQSADGTGQVEYLNFNLGGSYVEAGIENVNSGKKIDLYFNEAQLVRGNPNGFDVTSTSYADGATGVNPNLRNYRVTFSNNLNNPAAAAEEVVLLDSTGAEVEGVTRICGPNYVELKVYDDSVLEPISLNAGEQYTVLVKKRVIYDEVGQTLNSDKSYTFTTAEEGVKFAPSVVVTSPVDLERYAVGDTNTLKAMAFDDDGTVESVKFYNGEHLIGEAINEGDGLFTYEWSDIPASSSFTDYLEITAVATDNEGKSTTSAPVKLLVFDYIAPEIDAVIPTTYYNSIGGGKVDELIISGTFDDEDGYVKSIVIEIDDEEVYKVIDPIGNFSYTSPTQFAVKDGYKVDIIATDDNGMSTTVTEYFDSIAGSRASEPFYTKDTADVSNSGLWVKSSATIESKAVAGEGLVVTTKDSGNSTLTTTISDNVFKLDNTQVDVTLNFASNTNRRMISIGGIGIAEFRSNGMIVDNTGKAIGGGMKYSADTNYTLSLISNPATGMGVCLINGKVIKDLVTISPSAEMEIEITQTLSEDGSAGFTIVDYAAYMIGAAVTDATITLNKVGGTIADGATNVAVDAPTSIAVSMANLSADVDLTKAVILTDNVTGKACELEMVDGKLTIMSKLAHGTSYTIKLNSGLFNTSGETYAGDDALTFTTKATSAEKPVVVDRTETGAGFNVREISYTALGADGATVTFAPSIANDSGAAKTVYVAIIVYKGNKIVNKTIEAVSIANGGDDVSVSTVVPQIADDVSVQAFVLDSLINPKSLAEDVFIIR